MVYFKHHIARPNNFFKYIIHLKIFMDAFIQFWSVDNTLFTLFGYPMSYLEFFGTLFNLACVWLIARHNIWNWPIGIIGVIFFSALFYQIRLYSDLIEQVYYLLTGFYGWWVWLYAGKPNDKNEKTVLKITHSSPTHNLIYAGAIVIGTALLGWFMARIHIFFPTVFPEAASFPYLDAFTTVVSFAATILIIYKKIECWHLWILVDIIGVGLYFAKGVVFVSLLYFLFFIIATKGLITWRRIYNKEKTYDHRTGNRKILPAA